MSITTELREAINELRVECEEREDYRVLWYPEPSRDRFSEIADRIDAALVERYVELPEDADGKAIRVGDEVEYVDEPHVRRVVSGILLTHDGWWVYVGGTGRRPDKYRHHHVPTVEDVLRNVVTLCHNTWKEESPSHFYDVDDVMKSGNIAEYAAKLRLAGDAE